MAVILIMAVPVIVREVEGVRGVVFDGVIDFAQ